MHYTLGTETNESMNYKLALINMSGFKPFLKIFITIFSLFYF
jgi:hypothetical protein